MERINIAITRRVRPGAEQAFEQALREFARESLHEPGTVGVHLIGPVPGSDGGEFGILRSFESEEARRAFYESDRYKQWNERIDSLVEGPPTLRRLHGMEAFFRGSKQPPPRWKMAIVTWLGVYPTVLFWSWLLPPLMPNWPYLLASALANVAIVATLTWLVMPFLTSLFAPFLQTTSLQGK